MSDGFRSQLRPYGIIAREELFMRRRRRKALAVLRDWRSFEVLSLSHHHTPTSLDLEMEPKRLLSWLPEAEKRGFIPNSELHT